MKKRKINNSDRFEYTSEGLKKARKFAKRIGKLEELKSRGNGFSTDGYSQIQMCNHWFRELKENGEL